MSTTVDQRVVEMRFDNARFEQNVATSMSTLAKLKQSLNLSGASKGLEQINAAAKSNSLPTLGNAAETVGMKFSAMQVVGVTALANIANQAVNSAKRMISAFTIDPIKTGFSEYETKINSIQTIMSNTASKGTTMADVTKVIDELNTYADKTIYNFAEMTRNIGTFTAAGIGLEDSAKAIQGIANLAAVSGSNSQQASTAMYQLSQAMAAGTVKLMDWNSVVNAGMGGQVFQDALKATARAHGVAVDEIIEANGSFRESLQEGWITAEILTETLSKMTRSGAAEYLSNLTGIEQNQITAVQELVANTKDGSKTYDELAEKLAATGKVSKDEALEILKMADNAEDAATKVKTFTQLMDTLKESVQSGWGKTWELLIGNFEEAKELFTTISDAVGGFIDTMSDARNDVLAAALDSPFGKTIEKVKELTSATKKVVEATEKYAQVVDKVIGGEYGNGQARWDKLTKEGYDWAKVQNMVNEKLGSSIRHTEKLTEAQNESNKSRATTVEQLMEMSDAELKVLGLEDEEIKSLRKLDETAKKAGYSLKEVIDNPDLLNGRNLLIDGFMNIGRAIAAVAKAAVGAWKDIFPPKTIEERAEKLYNFIAGFRKFTDGLILTGDNAKNLERTLKGVFAAFDIVLTVLGGPLKWAFDAVIKLLGEFDIDILEHTAKIGDAIVKVRDWIDENNLFLKAIDLIAPHLKKAVDAVTEWINKNDGFLEKIKLIGPRLKEAADAVRNWFSSLKGASPQKIAEAIGSGFGAAVNFIRDKLGSLKTVVYNKAKEIAGYLSDGLNNGIWDEIKRVGQAIVDFATTVITKFCEVTGINSPSKVFYALGGFLVTGLLLGIMAFAPQVWDYIKELGTKCGEVLSNIDFGSIFAAVLSAGIVTALIKFADGFGKFASMFEGLGDMFEEFGDSAKRMSKGVQKALSGFGFKQRAEGIYKLAIGIGVLAASVFLLAQLDGPQLAQAMISIGLLMGLIIALTLVVDKMNSVGNLKDVGSNIKSWSSLIAVAASLLLVAFALEKMAGIDQNGILQAVGLFTLVIVGLIGLTAVIGKLVKGDVAQNIDKVGKMFVKLSIAMLLMIGVIKVANMLSPEDAKYGGKVVLAIAGGFLAILAGFALINRFIGGTYSRDIGTGLLKISVALLLMLGVVKIAAGLDPQEAKWGAKVVSVMIAGILGMLLGFALINKYVGSSSVDKLGTTLLAISAAILILTATAKLIATMEWGEMGKAAVGILGLSAIIAGLIYATKFAGKDLKGVGVTLLLVSLSIGILAGVAALLGLLKIEHLAKGIIAVGLISAIMAGLIIATGKAKDCKDNLIVMTIAIVALAGAIAALSLIKTEKLVVATLALSLVIGMFALLVNASGHINQGMGVLIVLTVAIGVLAGAIYLIGQLPVESAIASAVALGVLMLALTGALKLLEFVKAGNALGGVLGLLALAVPLLAFVGILALMQGVENATANATALVLLAGALTLLLIPLTIIGSFVAGAIMGVASLLLMAVPLVAFVGILYLMEGLEDATKNVNLLITMMTVMTGLLTVLAVIGPFALVGEVALLGLIALIGVVAVFATAVGALATHFPSLEEFLNKGLGLLSDVAYGIGKFAGDLIAGFADGVMEILPNIGTKLSEFMNNAADFIAGASGIDESVLTGVGILAGALLALTAADLISGLASLVTGESSLADLGTELSMFMNNAQGFISGVSMLDTTMLDGVKALAEAILILTAADILDGIASFFGAGESSLSAFGDQLPLLGANLAAFATNLGTFDDGAVTTVECAANAILAIAKAAKEIPNEGGWAGKIFGENNIGDFASKLPDLGTNLAAFATNLGTFDDNTVATVDSAANAILAIAKAAKEIPNEGGWAAKIFGENNIGDFASKLPDLGTNLAAFATNLGTFDDGKVSTVNCAAQAIAAMAEAASKIDGQADWAKKIFGDNSLATFGSQLGGLGTNLAAFATNLGTFGDDKVTTVRSAVNAINALANLADADLKAAKNDIGDFGEKIVDLASDITDFVTDMPASTSITTAISNIDKVLGAIKKLSDANADTAVNFTNSLKNLGKNAISAFVKAFDEGGSDAEKAGKKLADKAIDGVEAKESDMKKAGEKLGDKLIEGIEAKESSVKSAFGDAAKEGKNKIRDYYSDFKSAGEYLVKGFAAGISENDYKAVAKAKAMAKAAKQAAEEALGIASPSKEFYKIGAFTVAGFVNALSDSAREVYVAGEGMADSAHKGLAGAISAVNELLYGDMDLQPTIRPVLDLSGVQSGVGAINGMFGNGRVLSATANLNAVSSMASRMGQNGNDDVVSAINKLSKQLGNIKSDTTSIGSVTVEEGTAVHDAVKTLVRAVKVEGRR